MTRSALCRPGCSAADCTRFTLGGPLIRIEALRERREVPAAWQTTSSCDEASLRPSPLGVVHETSNEADRLSTDASTSRPRVQNSDIPRQAKRTRSRAGRTSHQRMTSKQRKKDKRGRTWTRRSTLSVCLVALSSTFASPALAAGTSEVLQSVADFTGFDCSNARSDMPGC